MKWALRIVLGLILVLVVAVVAVWIWKPWVPPVQMAEPGETGRRIDEAGLVANYHPAEAGAGILVLGGSEGGLGIGAHRMALALHEAGFSVLQLGYFRAPGQPESLELIPLETMVQGLEWLAAQPEVDPSRIGILGASKGAEAALLVAVRWPEVGAVVLGMPSSVAWYGIDWSAGGGGEAPSWAWEDAPVPALPYGAFDWESGILSVYANGLAALDEHPDAIIPVERVEAPVLMICGEQDTLWPACRMADQIAERARAAGGPEVTVLRHADAGHGVFGVPVEPDEPGHDRLGSLGGTPAGNARARKASWPKAVAFLRTHLAATSTATVGPD